MEMHTAITYGNQLRGAEAAGKQEMLPEQMRQKMAMQGRGSEMATFRFWGRGTGGKILILNHT